VTVISGYDEFLGFFNARISSFSVSEKQNEITVEIVDGVDAYPPHPLYQSFSAEDPCRIVFKGVKSFVKKISYYSEEDGKIVVEPPVIERAQLSINANIQTKALGIEGVLIDENKSNLAWFDCEVNANEILLDDLK
jgi:hypothetical protein